jgi:hypothetical protein
VVGVRRERERCTRTRYDALRASENAPVLGADIDADMEADADTDGDADAEANSFDAEAAARCSAAGTASAGYILGAERRPLNAKPGNAAAAEAAESRKHRRASFPEVDEVRESRESCEARSRTFLLKSAVAVERERAEPRECENL